MTTANRLNVWMATTIAERDALGLDDGLLPGDYCLLRSPTNLYYCQSATPISSNWRPIGGLPSFGHYGLGARNEGAVLRSVFQLSACSFRAVLDATPSSVTIIPAGNFNWPSTPTVTAVSTTGFRYSGASASIAAGANAWTQGTYAVQY